MKGLTAGRNCCDDCAEKVAWRDWVPEIVTRAQNPSFYNEQ